MTLNTHADVTVEKAGEWCHRRGRADFSAMPLTRLANKAIDLIAPAPDETVTRLVAHGETDLLCHLVEGPEALVRRQEAAWRPVLEWADRTLGVRLHAVTGIMGARQPDASLAALGAALGGLGPFRLAAAEEAAAVTGSVVLALALAHLHVDAEHAWAASRVDEEWQIEHWGRDPEADAQAAARRTRLDPAVRVFAILGPPAQ